MKKEFVYLFIFGFITLFTNAQTFEKDMEQVNKKFVNTPKISYKINYILRESHDESSRIISKNTGKYAKSNSTYISVYDTKATLVNPGEIILIDGGDKHIRVKKSSVKNTPAAPDFMAQLKEYNSNVSAITRHTQEKDLVMYDVTLKDVGFFPITHYQLTIDTRNGYVKQMSLFYKKPMEKDEDFKISGSEIPRLDILFSEFNNNKLLDAKELDPSYYYSRSDKNLFPSSNFKGYDVKEIF